MTQSVIACFYCGLPADTVDHIIPRVVVTALMDIQFTAGRMTVPACRECNSALGAKVFSDPLEKKRWIKVWLRQRYKRVLQMPPWSESELAELQFNLREMTEAALRLKELIKSRIAW